MDTFDPLMSVYRENADYNYADSRTETVALMQRNDAIEAHLKGLISADDLFDLLESQGIDPMEWMKVATTNLNNAVTQGIRFKSDESGLLLPQYLFS